MKHIFIFFIKIYRLTLSKILPRSCRFIPSCSEYAITALGRFGVIRGGILAFYRIVRCNPYSEEVDDPVPAYFTLRRKK